MTPPTARARPARPSMSTAASNAVCLGFISTIKPEVSAIVNPWLIEDQGASGHHQPMVELHDGARLQLLMRRSGVRPAELADATGKSVQAVGKWVRTGAIARDVIPPICRRLNCSSDELLGLIPIEKISGEASPAPLWVTSSAAHERLWKSLSETAPALSPEVVTSFEILIRAISNASRPGPRATDYPGLLGGG